MFSILQPAVKGCNGAGIPPTCSTCGQVGHFLQNLRQDLDLLCKSVRATVLVAVPNPTRQSLGIHRALAALFVYQQGPVLTRNSIILDAQPSLRLRPPLRLPLQRAGMEETELQEFGLQGSDVRPGCRDK